MFNPSFKGGVHPPENKKLTEERSIENLSVPHTCFVPVQQHIGKPAIPVVQVGDYVQVGQLIAKADGFISSNIHASIPGKIASITNGPTPASASGLRIQIETHGNFASEKTPDKIEWDKLPPKDLLEKVFDAGIAGMGGASFPTHVKLSPPSNVKIDVLIINAAECEPYLTVDDALIKRSYKEIIEGIMITRTILGVKNVIIGVESNKKRSYKTIKEYLKKIGEKNIKIPMLKTKYPQGAEKQLIYSLTHRTVPSGGLPMEVGTVVQNIGTCFAIQQAVCYGTPLFERLVTVSGSLINKPGNYKIRIGTTIADIIRECGGLKEQPHKIVMGGPMCGQAVETTDIPIVKGTSGLLFLSKEESSAGRYANCIRCGRCVQACPINLLPFEIAANIEISRPECTERFSPLDCIQCGACSFICPSRRPVSHFVKVAQDYIRSKR
ncbi:MAG: electron transport complex subunit RsxC [Spirochaetes bacterium]|nr:electron transport complex subunit RsxC [Spirochaetota bacterium]MBN2770798.1 electron transport complex subunit RsxC [Spirochaetota bacterium]